MDPIERQQKRCYICLGYGHDQDDCPMKCENELNDLIPERHSAKLDRELEALQAKHDELAALVACFFAIQDAMIWGRPIYGNASIRLMERNRLSKALRKAVEGVR
jgi:hypothetical protein